MVAAGLCVIAAAALHVATAGQLFGQAQRPALLDADEAFRILPLKLADGRLRVEWDIAPGYYLYRDRISVSVIQPAGAAIGILDLPRGEVHHDAHLGDLEIFRNDVVATAALAAGSAGTAPVSRVRIHYQGCADAGVCFPPQEKDVAVNVAGAQ